MPSPFIGFHGSLLLSPTSNLHQSFTSKYLHLSSIPQEVLARLDALILDPHGHLASSEEGNEDGDNEQFEDAQDLCTDTDAKGEKVEKDTPSDE